MTHYETLGIERDANVDAVRKAFRSIARSSHPDVSSEASDHERFLAAKEAYETLSDAKRRAAYDRVLELREQRELQERLEARRIAEWQTQEEQSRKREEQRQRQSRAERPRRTASYGGRQVEEAPVYRPSSVDSSQVLEMTRQLNQRRFDDARNTASRLLQSDPRLAIAHAVLADIARARGDYSEAADRYAKAAQYAPHQPDFLRRHEQMLQMLERAGSRRIPQEISTLRPFPVVVGGMLILTMAAYLLLSGHTILFAYDPLMVAFSAPMVSMLAAAGVTIGVALSQANALDDFAALSGGSAIRIQPAVALTLMALLNFWLAAAMAVFVDVRQGSASRSLLVLVTAAGIVTALFAACMGSLALGFGGSAMLWGGNVVYPCAVLGWAASDAVKRSL